MARLQIPDIDKALQRYRESHHGAAPLYIIVSPSEASRVMEEIRARGGFPAEATVTEYNGAKVVAHDGVAEGDLQLSYELPGIGG